MYAPFFPLRRTRMALAGLTLVGAVAVVPPAVFAHNGEDHTAMAMGQLAADVDVAGAQTGMVMTASALRSHLNTLLQEHVYLAGSATGAALGGRTTEFQAAAGQLDQNTIELGQTIRAAYGPDAETAFLGLWRAHIGYFVDYTVGAATGDMAKQDQAVANLVQYTQDFGVLINSANPSLPAQAVTDLTLEHVLGLKDAVDLQAAGYPAEAYAALRAAAGHMHMIADPLAAATTQRFPAQFPRG